jgi:hypothetical protein
MPKLRVHNLAISVDGYVAGPDQNVDNPLGAGGTRLHEWNECVELACSPSVAHVRFERAAN